MKESQSLFVGSNFVFDRRRLLNETETAAVLVSEEEDIEHNINLD